MAILPTATTSTAWAAPLALAALAGALLVPDGTPARADVEGRTTVAQRIVAVGSGFRALRRAPGERYVVRGDVTAARRGRARRRRSLLYFAQMSDFQLADEESPARVEFLDPLGRSPFLRGAWRPWEALMPHVVDAAVRQINRFAARSPIRQRNGRRARMALALTTGDSADNQARDEVGWTVRLLEGGRLEPNSGISNAARYDPFCRLLVAAGQLDPSEARRYTGVQDYGDYLEGPDPPFYDPSRPRGSHFAGFPRYPGLMDRAQRSFEAAGLAVPSYVAFGNHDGLAQGNQAANRAFDDVAVGCLKPMAPVVDPFDPAAALRQLTPGLLQTLLVTDPRRVAVVPPDPDRTFVSKPQYKRLHFTGAQADGHGFAYVDRSEAAASRGAAGYYAWSPKARIRLIALDTLSEGGIAGRSQEGNLDHPQFRWLERELRRATSRDELVILFGHHAVDSLVSEVPDEAAPPCTLRDPARGHDLNPGCDLDPRNSSPVHDGRDLTRLLHRYPHAIAYVAGHSHVNRVLPFPNGGAGFWNVKLAAEADWPQQSRLLEVMDNRDGTLSIFGTIVDHAAPITPAPAGAPARRLGPRMLASIARALAANDPQAGAPNGEGARRDRNVELVVRDPRRGAARARRAARDQPRSATTTPLSSEATSSRSGS